MTKCRRLGLLDGLGPHKPTSVFKGTRKRIPGYIINLSACNARTNAACGWARCTGVLHTFSPGTTGFPGTARGVLVPRTSNSSTRNLQVHTDAFPWGAGHGTLRWTRASEQAGKALRSQGHQCAHVM